MSFMGLNKLNLPFIKIARFAVPLSTFLLILSLAVLAFKGLNFGIDFKGGTLILIETEVGVDVGDIRTELDSLSVGDVAVTSISGAPEGRAQNLIRIGDTGSTAISVEEIKAIQDGLTTEFANSEILKTTSIGGQVSGELIQKGLLAVGVTMVLIGIYIWLRFEWQFALGAVISLVHDVGLTLGLFSIFQLTFDLNIVAAILTIIGYSLNDTVVVYDRIRENLRRFKSMPILELLDHSINETLSRTTMTSFTTVLALVALFIFGGSELKGFSFAMIWGVVVGTFSSIFIASPLLSYFNVSRGEDKPKSTTAFADIDA